MVNSMTGFASVQSSVKAGDFSWDIKSVNGRGLDVRTRLPEGAEHLDAIIKKEISTRFARGTITVSLKYSPNQPAGADQIDPEILDQTLDRLAQIEARARQRDMTLAGFSAVDVDALMGANVQAGQHLVALSKSAQEALPKLLDQLLGARAKEGQALARLLEDQTKRMGALTDQALAIAQQRATAQAERLRGKLATLVGDHDAIDGDRLEQEVALIAVKSDVTEELDRLSLHVVAAQELLGSDKPIGRRLDFLMQEFNREANTLCAKSGFNDLTQIGLELKTTIDQMREQVQNVE